MTAYAVSSGQTGIGLALNSGDTLTVFAGGIATSTVVNSGGAEIISGGSASSDTIFAGGSLSVSSGGSASFDTIRSGGSETVGGTILIPTISGSGAVLDLLSGAIVGGGITFSGSGGGLLIGGTVMPKSTISGFGSGDTFDLTSIAFDSAGTAILTSTNVLKVTEGGTTYNLTLDPGHFFTGYYFHLASDGAGGTRVTEDTTPPAQTPVMLSDLSWAQGWGSADNPRIVTDVNGDGTSDYVGFGDQYTFIAYGGTFSGGGGTGPGFSTAVAAVKDFGTSEGYTADMQRGAAAAGVGDGDILYGQGYAGIYWYEATGETAKTDAAGNTYEVLQYQTIPNFYGNFGTEEGWTSDNGFQILKTGATDASASILGFGDNGIVVGPDAFASGATAADSYVIPLAVGNDLGWKQSVDVRTFTDQNGKTIDLNGDGIADFVGMGPNGLVYAYGSESGGSYTLGPLQTAHISGANSDLGEAQGWTDATTVRDIVYDAKTGYDDIIAFGAAGVYVSMGQNPNTHGGEAFGQLYLALADFGSNQGWSVSQTPRLVGDVTGDGIPDIVGFGTSDTYVAVGSRDSSGNLVFTVDPTRTIADYGSSDGWSGSTEQTVRTLGTVAATGSTPSHSDLILSGAYNTQIVPLTGSSGAVSSTTSGSASVTLSTSPGESAAPSPSAASPAFTTGIDPTVTISGSPVEGTTLTASAVVTGGFSGTTEFEWQRFYAGGWWNIPVELSPYTAGEVFTYVASPTYVVREEDENVSAIRVEADFVDNSGVTVAVVDSPSIGPVLAAPASLSLSAITGSAVPGATLSVSGLVTSEDYTGPPVFDWQRYYDGGWWDIPVELSPYSAGEVLTYVTTPTYVVRAEDANVLAIRVEAVYVDDTGQTFTAFSATGTSGAALTISQPPQLNAAGVTLGEDQASVALAITIASHDTDYTLGEVTLGGVPSGWSLSGDGAASIAPGVWTAGAGGLSGLVLVAPSPDEEATFTLSVTASESALGPDGILTASATTSFAVSVTPVAGAPVLTASDVAVAEGNAAATIALTLGDTKLYGDNTLGEVTLGGVPSGWSLSGDGAASIAPGVWTAGAGGLDALVLVSPSPDAATAFTLGVTAVASESGAPEAASATTSFAVSVTPVAGAPVLTASDVAVAEGNAAATIALTLGDTKLYGDNTLGEVTLGGVPSGWSLSGDGAASIAPGVWTAGAGGLDALVLVSPSPDAATAFTLGVTAVASESGAPEAASATTSFAVSVTPVAGAPVLTASDVAVAEGNAAATIALTLGDTKLYGDNTLGEVTLGGVPSGWSLSGDGAASIAPGVWTAGAGGLDALVLVSPSPDAATAFTLGVTAVASESGAPEAASATTSFAVSVTPVAGAPVLTASDVAVAEGNAAATIALTLGDTKLYGDNTLGEVTLGGVPSGWSLSGDGAASIAPGVWTAGAGGLDALVLVSPSPDAATAFTLGVTAVASESGAPEAASATTSFAVSVTPVAGAPVLTASDVAVAEGNAAATIALTLGDTKLYGDNTLGEVTLGGVPSGWSLSGDGAASIAPGVWTAGAGGLDALVLVSPSPDAATAFTLGVTAVASESGAPEAASATTSFAVSVTPVAGAPVLTASDVAVAEGNAAATIALTLGDTKLYGDNTLGEVTLGGVPSGWSLSGDGAASVAPGVWTAGAGGLDALMLVSPSPDAATAFTLGVTAVASESGAPEAASATTSFAVSVTPVAGAPVLTASDVAVAGGYPLPNTIALTIGDTKLYGDNTLGDVTITGVPSGWSLNHGTTGGNASTWIETPAQLSGLAIVAPGRTENTVVTLGLTASATEAGTSATTSTALQITINGEAPVLTASNATIGESTAAHSVALSITDSAYDRDDTLGNVTITGVLVGWSLNHGVTSGNASTWIETPAQLSGLSLVSPASGDEPTSFTLGVTASATEPGASGPSTATAALVVTIIAAAEPPVLTVHKSTGTTSAALSITETKFDSDDTLGNVKISVSGENASHPWTLSATPSLSLVGNGTLTVPAADVTALVMVGPGGFNHRTATLTVTALSTEAGASGTATATATLQVTLTGVQPAGVAGEPINLALSASGDAPGPVNVTIAGVPSGWTLNEATNLGGGTWATQTTDLSALTITTPVDFVGAALLSVSESWLNPDDSSASAFVTDNVEAFAPGNPIFALSGDDTLTGSGANDLFVFAQPIADDRIYDFQPASSRIDLVGFPGIASFADLQGKIANDANGNAVLTLGSGETITIVGVDAASLGSGNFLFDAEPVTQNAGAMTIGDGSTLPLGGTVINMGTIALDSAGGESDLVILSDGVTLQGGGAVALSDNAGNAIVGSGAGTTLTNLDNIVSGAGSLGDAAMTLDNSGIIDATGVNPLIIDTGSNSILNAGTLEATGAGGLVIKGAVANSGTLSADGGNLTVDGAVSGAGAAVIGGTATLEFGAASAENTSFAPGAAGTLKLDQSASFTGVVAGFAAGDSIDLTDLAFGGNIALGYTDNGAGGGVVTVGNAVQVVDLALLGQYAAAGFHAQSDPGGGTLITYTLQTSATDPTSLTNPTH